MRVLLLSALVAACGSSAFAQRADLINCPCGPDWLIGPDRALIPQGWYGADFREACRRHDACLRNGCCNRLRCDLQFRRDLFAAARNSCRPAQARVIASLMYRGVRMYGGRPLSSQEKNYAVARLRDLNARFGRYIPPSGIVY